MTVEGDAGGDAHAFGVSGDRALGGDAVDGAFGAGTGVEVAVGAEGEAGGVEQIADERADLEVALDLKDGDGNGLAAGSGDGGVDVAVRVDCGVGYGVEIFGHGNGDAEVEGVAVSCAAVEDEIAGDGALGDADGGAGGAAEDDGGGDVADGGVGDLGGVGSRWWPWMSTSPPGMAARGVTRSRCGGASGLSGRQEGTECGHGLI